MLKSNTKALLICLGIFSILAGMSYFFVNETSLIITATVLSILTVISIVVLKLYLKRDKKRMDELIHLYEIVNKVTQDVIWDYHIHEDKLYWMQGFEDTYGYNMESSPKNFWEMSKVYKDDRARIKTAFKDILDKKQPEWTLEYRYICANGNFKYVRDKGQTLFDELNIPVRLIGALQDIDQQIKYQQKLLRQNARLKEIAWTNSHQVRRPLANILALSKLINAAKQQDEIGDLSDMLSNSAQELDDAVVLINSQIISDEE